MMITGTRFLNTTFRLQLGYHIVKQLMRQASKIHYVGRGGLLWATQTTVNDINDLCKRNNNAIAIVVILLCSPRTSGNLPVHML